MTPEKEFEKQVADVRQKIASKIAYNTNRAERIEMLLNRKSASRLSLQKSKRMLSRKFEAKAEIERAQKLLEQLEVELAGRNKE